MEQEITTRKKQLTIIIKIAILFWMFSVVLAHLLLFGPPEFWSISERFGLGTSFQEWREVLQPLFTSVYKS